MKKKSVFMTGKWEDLIINTYSCHPSILKPYLFDDIELDLFNNRAVFSMVAFTFSKVSLFNFKIPLHQRFGEINFRCYVKSKINGSKGVLFIKEYAPKPLIALVANKVYNEPFFYLNIKRSEKESADAKSLVYSFGKGKKFYNIEVLADKYEKRYAYTPFEKFVVNRDLAFVKHRHNRSLLYKIDHIPWQLRYVKSAFTDPNIFGLLPASFYKSTHLATHFVDGSHIEVNKGQSHHIFGERQHQIKAKRLLV